jgi:hypothetical protein
MPNLLGDLKVPFVHFLAKACDQILRVHMLRLLTSVTIAQKLESLAAVAVVIKNLLNKRVRWLILMMDTCSQKELIG